MKLTISFDSRNSTTRFKSRNCKKVTRDNDANFDSSHLHLNVVKVDFLMIMLDCNLSLTFNAACICIIEN